MQDKAPRRFSLRAFAFIASAGACSLAVAAAMAAASDKPVPSQFDAVHAQSFLDSNCTACHSDKLKTSGLTLEKTALSPVGPNAAVWEGVVAKLQAGEMPPPNVKKRPDPHETGELVSWLVGSLDKYAAANPNPGRPVVRRMTRAEFSNSVRDLLNIDVHPGDDLPPDTVAYTFNNNGNALSLSPLLLEKYLGVARRVARLATNDPSLLKTTYSYPLNDHAHEWWMTMPPDKQSTWMDGVPFGATSGQAFSYYFPAEGDYTFRAYLNTTQLPSDTPEVANHRRFEYRTHVKAGLHQVAVVIAAEHGLPEGPTSPSNGSAGQLPGPVDTIGSLKINPLLDIRLDGKRIQRFEVLPYVLTDLRAENAATPGVPSIRQVQVEGPFNAVGTSSSPSRDKIFLCHPKTPAEENPCAQRIIGTLLRQAFRREITPADMKPFMALYQKARGDGFDEGIRETLQAILISPNFIFRVEQDPAGAAPDKNYRLNGYEMATRLSFLLWSSIPDDRLLADAKAGRLNTPEGVRREVVRMLADSKAAALVDNFGMQYVGLADMDDFFPEKNAYPDVQLTLRAEFKEETRRFLKDIIQGNNSIVGLVNANYSYLNADLARNYGIDGVVGDQFRKVVFKPGTPRAGVLTQGSVLMTTSHEDITSPVYRGKWILTNLLNQPPPNPPPGVPPIEARDPSGHALTGREQLEMHRKSPICASCHTRMDPFGFSLENFDVMGRWRTKDEGGAINTAVTLPDGSGWTGVDGLKQRLAGHPEQLANAFAGRLMVYALGRRLEASDQPALRAIVQASAARGYRFNDILMGVINSVQFQMRRTGQS